MSSIRILVPALLSAAILLPLSGCDQSGGTAPEASVKAASMEKPPAEKPAQMTKPTSGTETGATAGDPEMNESLAVGDRSTGRPKQLAKDPRLALTPPEGADLSGGSKQIQIGGDDAAQELAQTTDVMIDGPGVVLEPANLELGEIPTNDSGVGIVVLRNTGESPRKVLDCKTSCGCTTANCQKGKTLEPGETMEVEIKLSGGARAQKLAKTVTFLVSGQPPLRLPVSGEAVSFVTVTPTRLDPDTHPDGQIILTAVDDTPFTIRSMYPPVVDEFDTEPRTEQVVYFPWEKFKEQGHRSTKILFTLDHPKCTKVNATLSPTALPAAARKVPGDRPAPGGADLDRLLKEEKTDEVLKMIADGEVKVAGVDNSGQTPLVKAARWGNPEVIQALLDESADISVGDRIGRTPLMFACQSKNIEAVRVLLDAGADINARDQIGNTALCWAAGFGDSATVKEILGAGGQLEVSGPLMGFTPLIWASLSGEAESIKALLDGGANIEAADVLQGATPLMHAVRTGGPENVRVLLDAGAKLEAKDNEGKTVLLTAASNAGADADLVRLLLEAGADTTARSAAGYDALELARKRTDLRAADVVRVLEAAMGGRKAGDEE